MTINIDNLQNICMLAAELEKVKNREWDIYM